MRQGPSENALLLKTVKEQGLLGGRHHIVILNRARLNDTMDKLSGLLRADNLGHICTHMLREIELAKPFSAVMYFMPHDGDIHMIKGMEGIIHILDPVSIRSDLLEMWEYHQKLHERYRK